MTAPMLMLKGLVKRYGGLTATDHLDLQVAPGHIHAIIGPNGAGKTTLIQQIAGGLRPDEGHILLHDTDISQRPMHERVHLGLARSYQITNIFKSFSVLDNLTLAVQARRTRRIRYWRPAIADDALFQDARHWAQHIGLGDKLHTLTRHLAHGEQRQLEVGLALATQPKLILLDEPMAGMGPQESHQLVGLIQGMRQDGMTVILVEHDMETVFELADRISVLVAGRIIATGSADDIRHDPDVRRAYLGDEVPV